MSEPKFKPGDHVTYHDKDFVIAEILFKHERGWMYTFVDMPHFTVVEGVLTGDMEPQTTKISEVKNARNDAPMSKL